MKHIIWSLILLSLLAACGEDEKQEPARPFENQVRLHFIDSSKEDKAYGYGKQLSSVECLYDQKTDNLRVVAYKFSESGAFRIVESLQITDLAIENTKSGLLKSTSEEEVPAFIFLSEPIDLEFTSNSSCSTYYDITGDEIKGTVLCSALESNQNEKTFVSVEFQCRNQKYILFEVKEEML